MEMKCLPLRTALALVTISALALFGCQSKRPENVLSLNSSLRIPEAQIAQAISSAHAGDSDAAFRLFQHYHYIEHNRASALVWLTKAAELGHSVAQYSLGQEYSGAFHPEMKDLPEARFWLQKAAANGVKEAEEKLRQLPK
jgi:TPR repeat protein